METTEENGISIPEGSDDKASLRHSLEEILLKPENHSQESQNHDIDNITVQTTQLKDEIEERIKTNTEVSREDLISDIKIEVEKIFEDCCETTDDEPLAKHIGIKKKRKIASELYDFLDIEKLKRIKAEADDSPVTETTEQKQKDLMSPVVYTTRLDDMNIYRKKLKYLERSYIWEEILRESKPVYNYLQQTINLTDLTHINKNPEKIINFINRINNIEPQIEELEDLKVIEICSPSSKSGSQSNEDNGKAGKIKVKRKREASDKIDEQTIINIDDDLIDLTNIPALKDKDIEKDTIQTDTILSYRSQDLIEKVIHKNNILLENLQTTRMDILKQLNDMESSEELEADVSVDNIPKLETTERRESLSQDITDLTQENRSETSITPIVYTTRLDEMLVLRYSLKYLDGKYALKEILRESKPNIKLLRKQKNKANSCTRISFKRLKVKLKILNRKNKDNNVDMKKSIDTPTLNNCNVSRTEFLCHSIHSTDNTSLLLDLNNPGSNFFISNPNTTELERVEVCQNIALIIHNKYSDQANMFLTDDRGNVTDYRSWTIGRSPNLDDLYKENDPKKKIIKLSTCCWFHTKANVEKVWTRTATGIARFVQSIHKCLPGICKCCCKPRRISGSFKLKFDTIKEDENKKKTLKRDKINSLIGRALEYRKRNVVKENNKTKPDIGQPLLIEVNKGKKDYRGDALEYFGINAKGNVEWQNAFYRWRMYSLDHITRLKRWMGANTSELKYNINNHNWLMCTLKAFDVPFNTIKYVKLTETSDDSQIKDNPSRKPDLLQLIMDTPVIEHTRKCAEVKLIKIKDILNSNPVPKRGTIRVKNVDKMMPNILLINPEPSTSGLSTGCPPNAIVQPLQPTQLIRPVQPVQPMQPIQPMQLIQPTQPVRPMQLVQPMQTVQPVQLMKPIQSQQSVPSTKPQYRSQSSQTLPYSKPIRPKPPPQPEPVVNLSKRLIVTCTEFPQMVNVIEDVAPDAAMRLLDEFRNITFQIKQGKIIATLKSSEKTTLTDKFQILAKILQITQSEISNHASVQDMILNINIRCEPMTSERGNAVIVVHPLETVPRAFEETAVRNVTQTDTDTKSTHAATTNKTIIEKFVQNKFAQFSRYGMFEKKSYKKSFQMYIKSEEEKRADKDDMVFPVISNVFSLSDSKSTDLLNEAPKNDLKDSSSSFESSNSIVLINDVGNQAGQSALPVNQNYVQMVPEVNKNNSSALKGILKNDLSDSCSSLASSSNIVMVNDENSQSSQLPLPAYPNFVQTAGQNQLLHISSQTIVENTIATMVNKNNTLLRSLLEKKTDIIFDNVLQKKKKK